MKSIIGQTLPASRDATIRMKIVRQAKINCGTPREAIITLFDNRVTRVRYKYNWLARVWYTSTTGRKYWKVTA